MFSMGSSRGFHYCSYHSDERSRSLIWLKPNHQAKIRSKFPLVTKTTNQANYFGLTNFGVLTQIPGSSVVVVTGQGGCPMKELRRRQTSCCQADSERGSQGICKPGPRHANSCLVLLIQSRTLGVSPCLWHGGTRQWHRWLSQGNTPAVSTLAWDVNKFGWILPRKSLFFSSCLQEVLHCRSLQDWENYTFRGDGTGSPKGQQIGNALLRILLLLWITPKVPQALVISLFTSASTEAPAMGSPRSSFSGQSYRI